jgi:fatty-acyl-CoA synthase
MTTGTPTSVAAPSVGSRRASGNVADWPAFHGRFAGDRPALRFGGRTTSWGELDDRVRRVAQGLRDAGVERGSRVGLLLRNHPAFLETFFAAARLGATAAPMNIRMAAPEVRGCLEAGRVSTLVSEEHFADLIAGLDGAVAEERIYMVDAGHSPSLGRPYEDLLSASAERGAPESVALDEPALLMYTSGTSGRPKGALLTHGNIIAVAAGARACDGTGPGDRLILPVPLAFCGPLVAASMPVLAAGGSVGLERELDLDALVADLNAGWPTMLQVVPMVYEQIARRPDFGQTSFASVRVSKTGGAPIGWADLEAFHERGLSLVNSYGLTEGSGLSMQVPPHEALTRVGAVGLPILGHEVLVVDERDAPLAPGEEGELVIRGPGVMAGYDNDPEATQRTLRGGWLHTGDVGRADEDGFLTIVGRRTDLIISGGLNVYPAEIEQALAEHPGIEEIAVVGRPDPRFGEIPVACVVAAGEGSVALDDLRAFLSQRLADYKRPRDIVPFDVLPRGMSGKVLRKQLREEVALASKRLS